MSVKILYASDRLAVVEKPHGWLTTPARENTDPRPVLGLHLQEQLGHQIYPVHRLDFEVSGLTLWALDAKSHTRAQEWFENARVGKVYHAISRRGGALPHGAVEWKSTLAKGKRRAFEAPHGKDSTTIAQILEETVNAVSWELQAVTGRPHQLRFEMAKHGFPVLGDALYGGEMVAAKPNWIALRAVKLDLSRLSEEERLGLPAICETTSINLEGI